MLVNTLFNLSLSGTEQQFKTNSESKGQLLQNQRGFDFLSEPINSQYDWGLLEASLLSGNVKDKMAGKEN